MVMSPYLPLIVVGGALAYLNGVQRGVSGLLKNPIGDPDIDQRTFEALVNAKIAEFEFRTKWTRWNSYDTLQEAQKNVGIGFYSWIRNDWNNYVKANHELRKVSTPQVQKQLAQLKQHRAGGGSVGPRAEDVLLWWEKLAGKNLRPIPHFPFVTYGKTFRNFDEFAEFGKTAPMYIKRADVRPEHRRFF